jgi:CheY-like chemotaxis protein
VLLVEDEPGLRSVLAEALASEGFDVIPLASGADALALSAEQLAAIDVVVTDHGLPGASGIDVSLSLGQLRPELAFVLISGHVPPGDRERLPPGSRLLAKPFTGADLSRVVREVLAARVLPDPAGARSSG